MSKFDDLDDRLKRIEETQRGWKTHGFLPIEGEPVGIPPELEFAISTFVRIRYRGIDNGKYTQRTASLTMESNARYMLSPVLLTGMFSSRLKRQSL